MKKKNFLELKKELMAHHTMSLGKQEVIIRATLDNESLETEQEIELLNMLIDIMNELKFCKRCREEIENKIELEGDD